MNEIITLALGFSNAFLIRGTKTILVDTGMNVSTKKYQELFAKYDIEPHTINLIVITHGHVDHFAEASKVKELTGASVLCHRKALCALQNGENAPIVPRNELGRNMVKMLGKKMPVAASSMKPDLLMDEIFDLNDYGVAGKIIHTPGHTECSISVVLDSGAAFVGDILVPSFFTGETCIAYFASDEVALYESTKRLLTQAHTFYGGHGGPFTNAEVSALVEQEKVR